MKSSRCEGWRTRRLLEFILKEFWKRPLQKCKYFKDSQKITKKRPKASINESTRIKELSISWTMEKLDHLTKPLHIYLLSLIKNHSTSLVEKIDMFLTHPKPSKPNPPIPRRTWNGWNGHQTLWPFSWYLHQEGHLDARIEWLIPCPPLRRVTLSSLQNDLFKAWYSITGYRSSSK